MQDIRQFIAPVVRGRGAKSRRRREAADGIVLGLALAVPVWIGLVWALWLLL